jgi:hypothetical protein
MMYPEVHIHAGANLCWSAVEAQGTPNATELTVISSSPPTKMEDPITMGHLRAVTEPVQSLGQYPQLNWRSLLLVDGARKLAAGAKLTWEQTVLMRGG